MFTKRKKNIKLASGITWYLKHCIWCFKMETFLSYLDFTFVTENRCNVVFFFNHHLKSAFLKHGCNKTSTETCIWTLWIFRAQHNDKRQKIACLLGGIPFPIKIIHSTMSTFHEKVYKMTQWYLIYMNPALPTSMMIFRYVSPPILV